MIDAERTRLLRGISSFKKEQTILIRVLRRFGPISQYDFDKLFGDYSYKTDSNGYTSKYYRTPKLRFLLSGSAGFILGGCAFGDWPKWLELTQIMCSIGLIKIINIDGVIHYDT